MQAPRRSVRAFGAVIVAVLLASPAPGVAGPTPPAAGGALDPTFATKGTLELPGGESIAAGPGGSLWVLGSVVHTDGVTRYLNRFTSTGTADRTFVGATQTSNAVDLTVGPILTNPAGGAAYAINRCCRTKRPPISQVAVQAVSASGIRPAGAAGTVQWPLSAVAPKAPADADFVLGGVVRLSDGRMRACVSVYPGGERDPFAALVGFRADGTVDATVGAADTSMPAVGWTKLAGIDDCGFASAGLQQLFVDGADRLYVLGPASGVTPIATRVIRTSAAGAPDPAYGVAGAATVRSKTRSYNPLTAAITRTGGLYLGLSSKNSTPTAGSVATVVKLTADGARATGFGRNAVRRFFPSGGSSELDSIELGPGARLLVGVVYTSKGVRTGKLMAVSSATAARSESFGVHGSIVTGTLTWDILVRDGYLLTVGSRIPADPAAYLGTTVLQRRRL